MPTPDPAPGRDRPRRRPAPAGSAQERPSPTEQGRLLGVIAVAGVLGASTRYGLTLVLPTGPQPFPWATIAVNVSGSLALGVVAGLPLDRLRAPRLGTYVRPFLATGFLGAYTTYSTFALETDLLAKDGHAGTALAYVAASMAAGLAAAWTGILLVRRLSGPRPALGRG
jgi:CrcB protein